MHTPAAPSAAAPPVGALSPGLPIVWVEPFRVRACEVGPDGRARVLALCDYVQEAAGEHAAAAGVEAFDLADGPGTWVLARLRLRVAERPFARETVQVTTWPSAYDGLRAERDYVVTGADDAEIVRGVSTWVVMSVARRRPVRLPEVVHHFGPARRSRALPPADDPRPPEVTLAEARFTVRQADLDRVGHANNVRFAEWALEAAALVGCEAPRLRALDLYFRAEAVAGDTVVSAVGPAHDDEARDGAASRLAHALTRESDGRLLSVALSEWHPS